MLVARWQRWLGVVVVSVSVPGLVALLLRACVSTVG